MKSTLKKIHSLGNSLLISYIFLKIPSVVIVIHEFHHNFLRVYIAKQQLVPGC